jgi:hypothetical protein
MDILFVCTGRLLRHQRIVSTPISQRRVQVFPVHVAGKGPRLPHQPSNEVPIINRVLAPAPQARQALHQLLGIPDLDLLHADANLDLRADQPRRHRVGVVLHHNGAAPMHPHPLALQRLQASCRQRPQVRQLLGELRRPPRITLSEHAPEELPVRFAAGKVSAAAQQQPLLHRLLEMPM